MRTQAVKAAALTANIFQFAHCEMSNLTHDFIPYLHYTMLIENILGVCAYKKRQWR